MAINWSPLHERLGVPPQALTLEHVKAAVNERLTEADDLDWKRTLPGQSGAEIDELCKDVAAMANGRGGLIVYGIAEERGTGRAAAIEEVDVSEGQERRLRAIVARVRPFVAGIEIARLEGANLKGILVMRVPGSIDAPHVVGEQNHLGVPFRSGAETGWMTERDLERAYRSRFERRVDERQRLQDLVREVPEHLDPKLSWLVAVAAPRVPLSSAIPPPTRDVVTTVIQRASDISNTVVHAAGRPTVIRELGDAAHNPRVGLRRWIMQTRAQQDPDDLASFVHVEFRHDGAVAIGAALNGWYRPPFTDRVAVPTTYLESFVVDFGSVAQAYARALGATGAMACLLDIARAEPALPLAAIDNERIGGLTLSAMRQPPWSRTVRRFLQVDAELDPECDLAEPGVLAQIARDALAQFGLSTLHLVPESVPSS